MFRRQEPLLIGLVGRARVGKDTVAGFLRGFERVAFADPLRDFTQQVFAFSRAQVTTGLKDVVDVRYGFAPRKAMQQLGTEWGRALHPSIWVEYGMRRVAAALARDHDVVVTDVRFENEAEAIREAGGTIWRVTRPRYSDQAASHASELEQDGIQVDSLLVNDGDLSDLQVRVAYLLGGGK